MSVHAVKLCSRALVLIGERPIDSLETGGDAATTCRTLYSAAVEDLLSRYRWRFASKIVELERLGDAPLSRYDAQYQLPAEALAGEVYAVLYGDSPIDFDRFGDRIYTNAQESEVIYAEVKILPNESTWPGYFNSLIEFDLAAKFSVALANQPQLATYFEGKVLRQFAQARTLDSQMRTSRKIRLGGLRKWHRGRP